MKDKKNDEGISRRKWTAAAGATAASMGLEGCASLSNPGNDDAGIPLTGDDEHSDKLTLLWVRTQGPLHGYVKELAPLVKRSLVDKQFRERLCRSPHRIFEQQGISFPEGFTVKVVEDRTDVVHLVLPPRVETIQPERIDLLDSALTSGGTSFWKDDFDPLKLATPGDKGGKDSKKESLWPWGPFY